MQVYQFPGKKTSASISESYFLVTTDRVTLDILKQYVENQGIEDNRVKNNTKYKV